MNLHQYTINWVNMYCLPKARNDEKLHHILLKTMTKIYTIILLFFLLASGLLFGKITGKWTRVYPEVNGEIPKKRYDHYMCPIGDQKVIMIGGRGGGNPNYYANET